MERLTNESDVDAKTIDDKFHKLVAIFRQTFPIDAAQPQGGNLVRYRTFA